MSTPATPHGGIMLANGKRYLVENYAELLTAAYDQRQPWVEVIFSGSEVLRPSTMTMRASAIVGFFDAENIPPSMRPTRSTEAQSTEATGKPIKTSVTVESTGAKAAKPNRQPRRQRPHGTSNGNQAKPAD